MRGSDLTSSPATFPFNFAPYPEFAKPSAQGGSDGSGTQRKLSAILSADVKGYSHLIGDDEEWTVRTHEAFKLIFDSCPMFAQRWEGVEAMYIQRLTLAAFVITLLTVGFMNYSPANAQTDSPVPKDQTASVTAKIVEARDYTAEFVSLAKASLAQKPDELVQARKLYAMAYSKNNSWVAYVKTSIRQGNAKKLNKDSAYQTIADDASRSAVEFTNFVNSKTGQSKDISTILLAFADLGLKLWNAIKDSVDKDRVNAADAFEKDTKWQPWEEIGTGR